MADQSNTAGLSKCCVTGHLHKGDPKGKFQQLYGLNTYVTGSDASTTVVFLTDIWGPGVPNAQLLADELAEGTGYRIVAPDIADGDWISPELVKAISPQKSDPEPGVLEKAATTAKVGANLGPWLARHREAVTKPIVEKFLSHARGDTQVKKLGAIGFCWGARYAILFGHEGVTPHLDVIVAQHPSFVSVPDEFEKLDTPIQVNVGNDDAMMPLDQVEKAKTILDKKSDAQVNIIPDAAHGFSVRGDQNNDHERKQKDEATENAMNFLKKYLS